MQAGAQSKRWSGAGEWSGDGLRREVFFFESSGLDLYGSFYAAVEPTSPYGIVACSSWGVEADRSDPLVRSVALAMARLGGAGMVFHYPGHGDSFGNLAEVDLEDLSRAAADAVAEAERRCPGREWILAGFMLGASVVALAQCRTKVKTLLLVQPELRPGAYFRRLEERSQPLAPGPSPREMLEPGTVPGVVFGYPIPRRIAARGEAADDAVAEALAGFDGSGAIVRHPIRGEADPVPRPFEQVDVPGAWRFGTQNNPRLSAATVDWLTRHAGGAEVDG